MAIVDSEDLDKIHAYLAQPGVGINDRPGNIKTMLDFAAEKNLVKVTQYLIDHGADVNTRGQENAIANRPGVTPLCRAAYFNAIGVMDLLLRHGAEVNAPPGGPPPLLYAATQGNMLAVEMLVAHSASVNQEFGPYQTPLSEAMRNGHLDVARYLISHGATAGPGDVNLAAMAGSPELIDLALAAHPDQAMLNTAMATATSNGRMDEATRQRTLALLLAGGADPDAAQNGLPNGVLPNAVTAGTAAFLLDHGANSRLKLTGYELASGFVCTAANKDHLSLVRMLAGRGLDFRTPGSARVNPIGCAAEAGSVELIDFLVEHGASVAWPDWNGYVPIFHASSRVVLEDLIKHGADLNQPGEQRLKEGGFAPIPQFTPLSEAIKHSQWDKVALLLSMGADVRVQGGSFLKDVAVNGPPDLFTELLEHGVDINARDGSEETALMSAVRAERQDKVRLLCDHGADVNARDRMGRTALHLAVEAGNADMVRLLLASGADRGISYGERITPLAEARTAELRQLVGGGIAAPVIDAPSARDQADCSAALASRGVPTTGSDASTAPQTREPGEDWDYLDQAGEAANTVVDGRSYLFALSNDGGYFARVDADGVERIVCEYGKDAGEGGPLKVLTNYERLKARSMRDYKSISFESLQLQGLRGAVAILEASRQPRDSVPLQFNSDDNLLGDAATYRRDDILTYYLDHGVDPNLAWIDHPLARGGSARSSPAPALYVAVRSGSERSVELLLAHGANPDAADAPPQPGPQWVGTPALAVAVVSRSPAVVEALLAHGANPDMPTGHGFPPGVGIYAGYSQTLGGQVNQWIANWLFKPRYEGSDLVTNAAAMFRHGALPDPWLYGVLAELQLRARGNLVKLPEAVLNGVKTVPDSQQTRQVVEGIKATYPAISDLLSVGLRYRDAQPCDASTPPADLQYCLPKSLSSANTDLNSRFAKLVGTPGTDIATARSSQRAWIVARDKACGVKELPGVTQAGWLSYVLSDSSKAQCVLRYTRERAAGLPAAPSP